MDNSIYFFILKLLNCFYSDSKYVLIEKQGIVRGHKIDIDNVFSFYGIPYATAPTGVDRYKTALPPRSWNGIFEATEKFIACPQYFADLDQSIMKEDCLIANIFVPDTSETNLPVLLYIHGGSFQSGYASIMSGIGLASKGVISVHINYRVGIQGFLCLGTELVPGNAGAKDMVSAIKWVKKNIASFGGDPDNLTVGGSSSGSYSVEFLIVSPMSTGLFHKATLEGGCAIFPDATMRDPLLPAKKFAKEQGLSNIESLDSLEEFYRNLTDEDLRKEYSDHFYPCVETHDLEVEKFLVERPMVTIRNNNYKKVKLLTGLNKYEGLNIHFHYNPTLIKSNVTKFILQSLSYIIEDSKKAEVAARFADLYFSSGVTLEAFAYFNGDKMFAFPQYASSLLHARNGADVFLYYYTYNSSVNLPGNGNFPIKGPGHVASTMYIIESVNYTIYDEMKDYDFVIRDELKNIYVDFLTNGHPMSHLPSFWKSVEEDDPAYLHMDTYFVMSKYPIKERLQVWLDTFGLEFL